jgi:hypothetical protein
MAVGCLSCTNMYARVIFKCGIWTEPTLEKGKHGLYARWEIGRREYRYVPGALCRGHVTKLHPGADSQFSVEMPECVTGNCAYCCSACRCDRGWEAPTRSATPLQVELCAEVPVNAEHHRGQFGDQSTPAAHRL